MVAFQIFWFSIYRYGIFYALAFILGYFGLARIGQKGYFKSTPQLQTLLTTKLEDLILIIAVGVLIGGRLGHILIYGEGYYFSHPAEIFKLWEWGMSFIWGILGVVSSIWIYLRAQKLSTKDFLMIMDLILIFVPLGIVFGRFGNFLNQELYGISSSQLAPWLANLLSNLSLLHIYPAIDQLPRVNTNFLSILSEGLLIFITQIITFWHMQNQKKRKIWILSTNFLILYSLIRFFLEYLRADSQMEIITIFSKSQRFFLFFFLIGIVIRQKLKNRAPLPQKN